MKLKNFFFFALILLTGCVYSDKIQFNEDFSGSVEYEIDMTQFMMMMKQMSENDTSMSVNEVQSVEEMVDSLNKAGAFDDAKNIDGIQNFQVEGQNDVIKMSFDFDNLEALNRAYQEINLTDAMGMGVKDEGMNQPEPPKTTIEFSLEGDTFTYLLKKPEESADEMGDPEQMAQMAQFNTTLSFAKNIKSVEADNIDVSQNGNEVSFSYDLGLLMDKNTDNPKVIIEFE